MKFFKLQHQIRKSNDEISKAEMVTETMCTCNACGKIWHYGKQEIWEQKANSLSNTGKAMMCCGGCWPALFIKHKPVIDLKKCPACGSHNIKTEQVNYEISK